MTPGRMSLVEAFVTIMLAACAAEEGPGQLDGGDCSGPNLFLYKDKLCNLTPPDASPIPCEEKGDGRCYELCKQDTDCKDPARPYCSQIGLYNGGDWYCNRVVYVCQSKKGNICPGM